MPAYALPLPEEPDPCGTPAYRRRYRALVARYFLPETVVTRLTASEMIVAALLARQQIKAGCCDLTNLEIAAKTEVSATAIRGAFAKLEHEGFITAEMISPQTRRVRIADEQWISYVFERMGMSRQQL
ncbi:MULTISPECIES: hypothetical protein [Methylobacterium]|uniref:hypothetical protein n=1 Tax=Methylobacterium TaxID=407 RepID=UPI002F35D23A